MKIVADRKINDYGSRMTWEINRKLSDWCCVKLEHLSEGFIVDRTNEFPKPYLKIKSGDDYYSGEYTSEEEVSFCPFCGTKIEVEVGTKQEFKKYQCDQCNEIITENMLPTHRAKHDREILSKNPKPRFVSL